MKINKEQPTKKKSGMRMALIALLMALVVQMGINAEEKEGIIRDIETVLFADKVDRLVLRVDTDGNRIPDHNLGFPSPYLDNLSKYIQRFAERNMRIVFDDAGYKSLLSGNKDIDGFNTISIDNSNMLDLFPNEAARFKFAAEARRRQQAAPAPAPQPSAEERRIKELEAELERLRGGR